MYSLHKHTAFLSPTCSFCRGTFALLWLLILGRVKENVQHLSTCFYYKLVISNSRKPCLSLFLFRLQLLFFNEELNVRVWSETKQKNSKLMT